MKYIGAHVPVHGKLAEAPIFANQLGMKAFALFTRNPSRWKAPELKPDDVARFRSNCSELG